MDSLSLHRGGWRDARVVLQALFAELAVYLNRAGGWAAQAPTTDLRTPPPTSRSPTRTKQPICRCNNIPRHFLRPTMIEFALLFTCFRKLGPGFRKPSAGPVELGQPSAWYKALARLFSGRMSVGAVGGEGGVCAGLHRAQRWWHTGGHAGSSGAKAGSEVTMDGWAGSSVEIAVPIARYGR